MAKELYYKELPERLIASPIKSEHGINQSCYFVEETKEVFKRIESSTEMIRRYRYFSYLHSDVFVFPRTIVFKGKDHNDPDLELLGYLTPYIQGTVLGDLDRNVLISDMVNALATVSTGIMHEICYPMIDLCDVNLGNMIYTPDKEIKIIDTDLYEYSDIDEPSVLFRYNIAEFNMDIFPFIFKAIQRVNLNEHTVGKKIYKLYREAASGNCRPENILSLLKDILEEAYQKEHKTMQDIDNSLALIRKK